ncbi:phospholipase/carboxylesterase [Salinarchaeum sp. Harcht-Bsk1]|uniref:alpha/beta hydrolase n=1 Tax=Salinarchaeum sp. Harcht-Bsk1 TaxID=1333523 RepID=UPI0003423D3F|nr:dienelactone hydrolase family protein [Salinarchaeum sp. Harcht-Bsk1]AGN00573.1 phospholipase/carboxylesterase [Salinarchaeum sp. Harcht-Bsk1]
MSDPHGEATVVTAGAALEDASAAVVAMHGRGATARSVVDLVEQAAARRDVSDLAIRAPQAHRNTWYPNSFLAPIDANEPHLSSALGLVERTVAEAAEAVGREQVVLLGFSQGGCLASEFVARNPARYGGLVALSGGRIGPEGIEWDEEATLATAERDLEGTPAFLGCSDVDPHIPAERVHETAESLEALGGDVTVELYPGMGHTVNEDELEGVAGMLASATPG